MARHIPYEENHKQIGGVLYKRCNHHEIFFANENDWMILSEEYFHKNKSSPDNFNTWCKRCSKEKYKIKKTRPTYKEEQKRYQRFHYLKTNKKKAIYNKNYINSHLDYYKQKCSEWRTNNKNKVKEYQNKRKCKDHKISTKEWEDCKHYFNMRCAYCGLPIEEHYCTYRQILKLGDFHREHVIYMGKNNLSNCVPSCEICNSEKHDKSLHTWYNINNDKFDEKRYHKIYLWIRYDYKKYILPKSRYKHQGIKARLEEIESNKKEVI